MKDTYPRALAFVLHFEGGLCDVPGDNGGLTNEGITDAEYRLWRKRRGEEARSVRDMTAAERDAIYSESYWHTISGDSLPFPLDMVAFNCAVNMGVGEARMVLGHAMGREPSARPAAYNEAVIALRGKTAAAVREVANAYLEYDEERYVRLGQIPHDHKFLRGWLRRLNALRAAVGL